MTSKSAAPGDGDRSCANIANTIVRNAPSKKKFRFIAPIQEASAIDVDLKPQLSRATRRPRRNNSLESIRSYLLTCGTAIACLASGFRRLEQNSRCIAITRYGTDLIRRWKEIFVAVLHANLGSKIERDHA